MNQILVSLFSVFSLRNRREWLIWVCLNFILFFALYYLFPQGIFQAGPSDGFHDLIEDVVRLENHELALVHQLRFYSIFPFYFLDNQSNYLGQGLIVLLISLPIILHFAGNAGNLIIPLIIYSVFFISIRTYLCACSITYLYVLVTSKVRYEYILFFISMIFSILSSGVLAIWILIVVIFNRQLRYLNSYVYFLAIALAVFVLSASVMHKMAFFSELAGPVSQGSIGNDKDLLDIIYGIIKYVIDYVWIIIYRTSISTSINGGDFYKFGKYIVFIFLLSVAVVHAYRSGDRIWQFFLPGGFAILVEGLAFPSFFIVTLSYIVTIALPGIFHVGTKVGETVDLDRRVAGPDRSGQGPLRS